MDFLLPSNFILVDLYAGDLLLEAEIRLEILDKSDIKRITEAFCCDSGYFVTLIKIFLQI